MVHTHLGSRTVSTEGPQTSTSIHNLFEIRAQQQPTTISVELGSQQWTYQVLNSRANQLAHYLQSQGVGPNVLVGLCVERSLDMVVGILAILKAGGAYVPLDAGYPMERIAYMIDQAQVNIILTQSHFSSQLPAQEQSLFCLDTEWATLTQFPTTNPQSQITSDHLGYVIYTSGSTGKPKGVAMPHGPLLNLIRWQIHHSSVTDGKTLQYTPISFDVSFQEIFATFAAGGTLVLIEDHIRRDPQALLKVLQKKSIERLFLPFVALQQLATAAVRLNISLSSLKEVITAGEQLRITPALVDWFNNLSGCTLHNHYGPSESHVVTTYCLSGKSHTWPLLPPIGKAIDNAEIHLLDHELNPVKTGTVGEIYIGGACLAKEYLHQPSLTAKQFIQMTGPTANYRLYKTGDLARQLPSGDYEYLGRSDEQVKIRGHRVEPGGIETRLDQHPQVKEVIIVAQEAQPGDRQLFGYITTEAEASPTLGETLRQFLSAQLPEYMVPSHIICLEAFPLTPSGKIDRRSLPIPRREGTQEGMPFVSPQTPLETEIAELWKAVLSINRVGVDDHFFNLGGHSLLASELMFCLQEQFEVHLSLADMFSAPTIADQAQLICDRKSDTHPVETTLDLWAEAVLADDIYPKTTLQANISDPEAVLLTGATGFLGAFLLHEILQQTQARIYCLVRAKSTSIAQQRIQANLEQFSLWRPDLSDRIIAVPGDLSKPQLSLSLEDFRALAETVDIIYHNGAMVNFMHPYSVMKATNVSSTQSLIRLASQFKIKPIHFLSTVDVFSPIAYDDNQVIHAQDKADRSQGLYGYPQSKWVAEKLLAIAQDRGIPSSIYRPTWIEGHSQTGVCNSNDFLRGLIKGCIQLGVAPDWAMPIDLVPVDYISQAIVHFSRHQQAIGQAFNFINPQAIMWNQLVDWINAYGYPLQRIPYSDWLSLITIEIKPGSDNALGPFLAFLTDCSNEYTMTIPEMYCKAQGLQFETQHLYQALANWTEPCPTVMEVLPIYFDYFVRSGFLKPPLP